MAARGVSKTAVLAPVDGVIQQRLVSTGTYVANGQALFQVATRATLRVHLPLPETVLGRLRAGQTVYLTTPTAPGQTVTGTRDRAATDGQRRQPRRRGDRRTAQPG